MRKINKNNQNDKIKRGISAISLAAVATMGLAGCRADEPMVLYGMPDDMMIQEELDKAASETSESETDEPMDLYGMPDDTMIQEELDKASETSESEAVDINEDKSNDENVIAKTETDDAIVADPEK